MKLSNLALSTITSSSLVASNVVTSTEYNYITQTIAVCESTDAHNSVHTSYISLASGFMQGQNPTFSSVKNDNNYGTSTNSPSEILITGSPDANSGVSTAFSPTESKTQTLTAAVTDKSDQGSSSVDATDRSVQGSSSVTTSKSTQGSSSVDATDRSVQGSSSVTTSKSTQGSSSVDATNKSTSTASSTVSSSDQGSISSSTPETSFAVEMLAAQNAMRNLHKDTNNLTWSDELAAYAQKIVDDYVCGAGELPVSSKYGQDISIRYATPEEAVMEWYNGIQYYDWHGGEPGQIYDQFTQMVWKNTTYLGCAVKLCGGSYNYYACEYYPRGNVPGEFMVNVAMPKVPTPFKSAVNSPSIASDVKGPFSSVILEAHNVRRRWHYNTPDLEWSEDLASIAETLVKNYDCATSFFLPKTAYGSNYAMDQSPEYAVYNWYSTMYQYNYNDPGFCFRGNPFAQIVWRSSTRLGCAKKDCNVWGVFVLCYYDPPGDIYGQYSDNVFPLIGSGAFNPHPNPYPVTGRPSVSQIGQGVDSVFAVEMVKTHNEKRALHQNTSTVSWSQNLADYAQSYANSYNCYQPLRHSNLPFGENLAITPSPQGAVDAWYNEIKAYNWSDPGFSHSTGHFTQVVWNHSRLVGCGVKDCGEWGNYYVCEYDPPGNVLGEFRENVLPLIK